VTAIDRTLRTSADLAAAGLLSEDAVTDADTVSARYSIAVPPNLARLIKEGSAALARQFIPDPRELNVAADERADPIGDHSHSPVKGVVHRYPDRALLMPTLTCAVYCRFCFRRETVGGSGTLTADELAAALAHIRSTPAIWEVILTGGDPLVLSARRIGALISELDTIAHVKVIRIHTRIPIATPERINGGLIAALKRSSKAIYISVHCNHAAELTLEAVAACARLADAGFQLLSQSVLLRGVNDSAEDLETLFRSLVAARVKPYYLHQLDYAPGTSHFRVPLAEGQALVRGLRGRLSGLALPTYILDIPGGAGKVPADGAHISPQDDGTYVVTDGANIKHPYPSRSR